MSEWSDQIVEMQHKWVEQQQKFMTDWLGSMRQAGGGTPQAGWREASNLMEQQVASALEAQKRSLLTIAENMEKVDAAPEEFKNAVKQIEDGIEQWSDVQSKMWKVWFDTLRQASPVPKTPAESMMDNWEDMVKQTMSIQDQWLSTWTGAAGASGGAPKKGAAGGAKKKVLTRHSAAREPATEVLARKSSTRINRTTST